MASQYIPHLVARAWEDLATKGTTRLEALRPVVAASWLRSQKAGVDPRDAIGKVTLSRSQVQDIIESRSEVIEVARPIMSDLYDFVAGSGFIVIISDELGHILDVIGDEKTLRQGALANLIPGSNWAENHVGTNGIGTALAIEKPIQILGEEHYCEALHQWTCSAAPIRSGAERIIGALQLSGPLSETHIHTLGMVVATAKSIETQVSSKIKVRRLALINSDLRKMVDVAHGGLALVDTEGTIQLTNPVADRLFASSTKQIGATSLMQMVDVPHYLEDMMVSGKAFEGVGMEVKTTSGHMLHCIVTGQPVHTEDGRISGGAVSFHPTDPVTEILSKYSTYYPALGFENIIGTDDRLLRAIELAKTAAERDSNVLISGESGTGKEMLAQAIHNTSRRAEGPFMVLSCSTMPRELVGSELFGDQDEAFIQGARGAHPGKLELASEGTLFLDGIGCLPLKEQASLCRVLQGRKTADTSVLQMTEVDARVICATTQDLEHAIAKGSFRQDLYYMLNTIHIFLPPLRERKDDIPLLFEHFLSESMEQLDVEISKVEPEVIDCLIAYSWPGNARELKHVVEHMVNIAKAGYIGVEHVPEEILHPDRYQAVSTLSDPKSPAAGPPTFEEQRTRIRRSAAQRQREELLRLLEKHDGNITRVATEMGVSRNTVYRRMQKLDLQR